MHLPLPKKNQHKKTPKQNKQKRGGGGEEKTHCQKLLTTLVLCGAPRMSLLNELGIAGGFLTLKCDFQEKGKEGIRTCDKQKNVLIT